MCNKCISMNLRLTILYLMLTVPALYAADNADKRLLFNKLIGETKEKKRVDELGLKNIKGPRVEESNVVIQLEETEKNVDRPYKELFQNALCDTLPWSLLTYMDNTEGNLETLDLVELVRSYGYDSRNFSTHESTIKVIIDAMVQFRKTKYPQREFGNCYTIYSFYPNESGEQICSRMVGMGYVCEDSNGKNEDVSISDITVHLAIRLCDDYQPLAQWVYGCEFSPENNFKESDIDRNKFWLSFAQKLSGNKCAKFITCLSRYAKLYTLTEEGTEVPINPLNQE